jgi:hypothetical protein
MSDELQRMNGWVTVACCALIGAVATGALAFVGLLVYLSLAEPTNRPDILGWHASAATIAGLGSAISGLIAGLIYGIVLKRQPKQDHTAFWCEFAELRRDKRARRTVNMPEPLDRDGLESPPLE